MEAAIVVAGLRLYLPRAAITLPRRIALGLPVVLVLVLVLAFTVLGMTLAPATPSVAAMAAGSLATLLMVCALVWWIGRPRT